MIRLTDKGRRVFNVTRDLSLNQITAIQSIVYERLTEANFSAVAAVPDTTLDTLREKELITGY